MAIKEPNLIKEEKFKVEEPNDVQIFDVVGVIDTVTDSPTTTPTSFSNQFKIKVDGATLKLQVYSTREQKWYESTLTEV